MRLRLISGAARIRLVLALLSAALSGPLLAAQAADKPAAAAKAAKPETEAGSTTAPANSKKPAKIAAKKADKNDLPRNVQRTVLQRMKSKKPEARQEAIRELAEYPGEESAKLLVLQGLTSKFEDVRKTSYETLLEFKDDEQVCDYLLDAIRKDMKKGTPRDVTSALLAVALASELAPVEQQAETVLEDAAKQPKGGLLLLVTLADGLGQQGDQTSLATLLKLAKLPLFEKEFAVRRSVVQALANVQELEAVDALIEMLGKLKGEVRGDIARYLTSISGEQHDLDAAAWLEWWKANRDAFQFPLRGQRVAVKVQPKTTSLYYGLPIYAQRLVFVIDTSGSMRGQRIEAAKRELTNAINALPEGVYFNVLAFHVGVFRWQPKLLVASAENKQSACAFVQLQGLGPATASYDALEAAMDLDAEAIYFLTDGAPRGGKVDQPEEIVGVLTRLNHTRRVTINSIGIGVGPSGNLFDTFLKTLSEQNYGDYRRVDE